MMFGLLLPCLIMAAVTPFKTSFHPSKQTQSQGFQQYKQLADEHPEIKTEVFQNGNEFLSILEDAPLPYIKSGYRLVKCNINVTIHLDRFFLKHNTAFKQINTIKDLEGFVQIFTPNEAISLLRSFTPQDGYGVEIRDLKDLKETSGIGWLNGIAAGLSRDLLSGQAHPFVYWQGWGILRDKAQYKIPSLNIKEVEGGYIIERAIKHHTQLMLTREHIAIDGRYTVLKQTPLPSSCKQITLALARKQKH